MKGVCSWHGLKSNPFNLSFQLFQTAKRNAVSVASIPSNQLIQLKIIFAKFNHCASVPWKSKHGSGSWRFHPSETGFWARLVGDQDWACWVGLGSGRVWWHCCWWNGSASHCPFEKFGCGCVAAACAFALAAHDRSVTPSVCLADMTFGQPIFLWCVDLSRRLVRLRLKWCLSAKGRAGGVAAHSNSSAMIQVWKSCCQIRPLHKERYKPHFLHTSHFLALHIFILAYFPFHCSTAGIQNPFHHFKISQLETDVERVQVGWYITVGLGPTKEERTYSMLFDRAYMDGWHARAQGATFGCRTINRMGRKKYVQNDECDNNEQQSRSSTRNLLNCGEEQVHDPPGSADS